MYPSTKVYFRHLGDHPDELQLLNHGQRMLQAVGVAVQSMDNLRAVLSPLAALDSHVPEHTALLSRLSALCFKCLISQDRIACGALGRPARVAQPGVQAQPLPPCTCSGVF